MRTPADYRAEAESYVRLADTLPPGTRRMRLLDMAQSCVRLADQAEQMVQTQKQNGQTPPDFDFVARVMGGEMGWPEDIKSK